jgi:hypothetical protein
VALCAARPRPTWASAVAQVAAHEYTVHRGKREAVFAGSEAAEVEEVLRDTLEMTEGVYAIGEWGAEGEEESGAATDATDPPIRDGATEFVLDTTLKVSRCRPVQTPSPSAACFVCLESTNQEDLPLWRDCACRGSAGWAHPVPCLVDAAKQQPATWDTCPTCKQRWTGNTQLTLAKERFRRSMDADIAEKIKTCDNLAMALDEVAGDTAGALDMFEESLRFEEMLHGRDHPDVLVTKSNISVLQMRTGNYRAARATLQETLAIERRDLGESNDRTLHTCEQLALAHASLCEFATAIPLMRQSLRMRMGKLGKAADRDPMTLISMGNLGNMLVENKVRSNELWSPLPHALHVLSVCVRVYRVRTQEYEPGVELLKEATFKLAKVLGKEHPDTQMMMGRLNEAARGSGMQPGGGGGSTPPASVPAPVLAQVCGLVNAADLNQCSATVVSWVEEKGRYQCRVRKHDGSFCSVGVKPGNLLLPAGTAVTVRGIAGVSWQH